MAKDFPMITLRGDCMAWERQLPRETELQYGRFLVYLKLGPESDRLRQALEVLNDTGDRLTYQSIKDYSSAFRWSARAAVWDRYQMAADRARMVRRRREAIDEQCQAARKLRGKALEALEAVDPADLSPADIVRFVDLSYRMEHSIFADVEGAAVSPESTADVRDVAAWSPAERARRLEQIGTELTRRRLRAVDDDEVVA